MQRRNNSFLHPNSEEDPISSVANLFDVAMVFAVALMVALVTNFNMTEMLTQEDFTKGEVITRYKSKQNAPGEGNKGKRVGVAYELENGEIIYVPE